MLEDVEVARSLNLQPEREGIAARLEAQTVDGQIEVPASRRDAADLIVDPGTEPGHQGSKVRVEANLEVWSRNLDARLVVQSKHDPIAAAEELEWLAVRVQEFELRESHVTVATAIVDAGEIGLEPARLGVVPHVGLDDLFGLPIHPQASLVYPNRAGTQVFDRRHVVRHEDHRPAPLTHFTHRAQALLLEGRIANRQHFVHEQDVRFQVRGYRKAQTKEHAG